MLTEELKQKFEKCHGISLERYGKILHERKQGKRVQGKSSKAAVIGHPMKSAKEIEEETERILEKW